jgi:hypothetical protein
MAGCTVDKAMMAWMGTAAISTTAVFVPAPGSYWRDATGINGARGWGALAGKTGNFQGAPAIEHTNDVRAAGTVVQVGSNITANGVSDPNGVTSLSLGSSRYIREGWLVSVTSGGTLACGNLGGVVEFIYGA